MDITDDYYDSDRERAEEETEEEIEKAIEKVEETKTEIEEELEDIYFIMIPYILGLIGECLDSLSFFEFFGAVSKTLRKRRDPKLYMNKQIDYMIDHSFGLNPQLIIHQCVYTDHLEVVKLILDRYRIVIDKNDLIFSVKSQTAKIIKVMCDYDINLKQHEQDLYDKYVEVIGDAGKMEWIKRRLNELEKIRCDYFITPALRWIIVDLLEGNYYYKGGVNMNDDQMIKLIKEALSKKGGSLPPSEPLLNLLIISW